MRLWWKTEVDSPLCGNISRETVSGGEISNRAHRKLPLGAMWQLGWIAVATEEIALYTEGHSRHIYMVSFKALLTARFKDGVPHPDLSNCRLLLQNFFLGIDDDSPLWQRCLLAQ